MLHPERQNDRTSCGGATVGCPLPQRTPLHRTRTPIPAVYAKAHVLSASSTSWGVDLCTRYSISTAAAIYALFAMSIVGVSPKGEGARDLLEAVMSEVKPDNTETSMSSPLRAVARVSAAFCGPCTAPQLICCPVQATLTREQTLWVKKY